MTVAFVDVCSFEEGGTTSKLHRLALRGKAHHDPALPEVLSSPSDRVHGWAWCWSPVPLIEKSTVDQKNNVQCESCELCFIWGIMRAVAWEAALQIALRNWPHCGPQHQGHSAISYAMLGQWPKALGQCLLQHHQPMWVQDTDLPLCFHSPRMSPTYLGWRSTPMYTGSRTNTTV